MARKKKRKNPDNQTLLLLGGVAVLAVGAYLFLGKKSAKPAGASTALAVPTIKSLQALSKVPMNALTDAQAKMLEDAMDSNGNMPWESGYDPKTAPLPVTA